MEKVIFDSARVELNGGQYQVLVDYVDCNQVTKTHLVFESPNEGQAKTICNEVIQKNIIFYFRSKIDLKSVEVEDNGIIVGCYPRGSVKAKIMRPHSTYRELLIYNLHILQNCVIIARLVSSGSLRVIIS